MSNPASGAKQSAAAETGQLQTLHHGLDVLEALASEGEGTIASLSERLAMARSTTHRLLTTLVNRGYARQDPTTGRFRIGVRSLEVGAAFMAQNPIKDLTRPFLRELSQQFNETITLAILDGDEAVYVDLVESSQTLRTFARIGARVPLYCTGVGKALLMGFTATQLRTYAKSKTLKAFTPSTITTGDTLLHDLERSHEAGYVLDREEYTPGVRCGAAPVRDHTGQVVAALSVSGPTYRMQDKIWLTTASSVAAAAKELSRVMGFKDPRSESHTRP